MLRDVIVIIYHECIRAGIVDLLKDRIHRRWEVLDAVSSYAMDN